MNRIVKDKKTGIMETIEVKIAWSNRNYSASLGDNVPGAVVFTATTFAQLQKTARESLEFHLKGMLEDGDVIPEWLLDGEYEFRYNCVDMATVLHLCEDFASLAAISRVSGINRYQLSHYANGLKKPRPEQRKRIMDSIHGIGKSLMAVD